MWKAPLVRLNDEMEQLIREKDTGISSVWLKAACLSNELMIGGAEPMDTESNSIRFNGN